jgi:hypothetical protein
MGTTIQAHTGLPTNSVRFYYCFDANRARPRANARARTRAGVNAPQKIDILE